MEHEELMAIKGMVDKSSSDNSANAMLQSRTTEHESIQTIIKGALYVDGTIPNKYLSEKQKGKQIPAGHRGDLVDIVGENGIIYFNVTVASESLVETKFRKDQAFEIVFPSADAAVTETYGVDGISDLTARPIKANVFRKVVTTFLSTYTPDSYDKMKGLPFCIEPPSVDDVMGNTSKVHPDMVVIATKKSDEERQAAYESALKKEIGISDNDPLPSDDEIKKDYPDAIEKAEDKALTNDDRAGLILDKKGIQMNTKSGKRGGLVIDEQGTKTKGSLDLDQKPRKPMDVVGLQATDMPVKDLMPKGNMFTVHPDKLPSLDDILSLGLMAVRLVNVVISVGAVIKDFSELESTK